MPFKPGQSGNPNGRPTKARALTAILETELNKTVTTSDGRHIAKKREMARMASDLLATGKTTFPDGRELAVEDFRDYLELIKWVYKHIDGDPPKSLEVSGKDGGPVVLSWQGEVIDLLKRGELSPDDVRAAYPDLASEFFVKAGVKLESDANGDS